MGHQYPGTIAQLGEHLPYKQGVTGSSPVVPTTFGPVGQLVRTLACHARGRRFEPVPGRHFFLQLAFVAQLVEQWTENPRVVGSIPTGGTNKFADVAHRVERHLAKVEVASSSLVIRSKKIGTCNSKSFIFLETKCALWHVKYTTCVKLLRSEVCFARVFGTLNFTLCLSQYFAMPLGITSHPQDT